MKANQPVVSTFSMPLNRNQANRTDPNLRQFPNNSYIPFDATFSPLPTRWNSKLWQSRNERIPDSLRALTFNRFTQTDDPLYIPFVSATFRKLVTSPRNWTLPHHFSKITRETHKISLDRSTRDERSDDDHFLTDSIINYVTFNHDIYRCI